MVLLSRSHSLERHSEDAIPNVDSFLASNAGGLSHGFSLANSLLHQGVILALVTAGVHEVAFRGLQHSSVPSAAQKAV